MLLALNVRADSLLAQGKASQGLKALDEVVRGLRELHGDTHKDTISSVGYYAQMLLKHDREERLDDSEAFARLACESARAALGEQHPDTVLATCTLSQVLMAQRKYAEAEACVRRVHAKAKAEIKDRGGRSSMDLHVASSNLAQLLAAQDRVAEALPYAREALQASIDTFGTHHSHTLDELCSIAPLLEEVGELDEAERVRRTELQTSRDTLGDQHPRTLVALAGLARLIAETAADAETERLEEAEALMIEDLQGSRQQYGDDHFDTMAAMSNLAQLYYKRGTFDDSLPIAREAASVCARLLGPANEQTALLHRLVRSVEAEIQRERQQLQRQQHEEEKEASAANASMLLLASWPSPGNHWAVQPM